MANHKSSEKRIRQTDVKKENNKYYAKTMRNALKDIRATTNKKEAAGTASENEFNARQACKEEHHSQEKASNLKSSLVKHVNNLK